MGAIAKNKYFLGVMALLAGLANGLLGAGGGIIVVYAFNMCLEGKLSDPRDIFANALCVMLPISAVSCVGYALMGKLTDNGLGTFIIPAVLGGICGGLLLGKINASLLRKLFAGIVIYSGITLMIK